MTHLLLCCYRKELYIGGAPRERRDVVLMKRQHALQLAVKAIVLVDGQGRSECEAISIRQDRLRFSYEALACIWCTNTCMFQPRCLAPQAGR